MAKFKVGDKVRRISHSVPWCPIGYETEVLEKEGLYGENMVTYRDADGGISRTNDQDFELIDPTSQGPVRTKTVKEVMPGVYGRVTVGLSGSNGQIEGYENWVSLGFGSHDWNATELRAAAATLLEIAEALDAQG